MMDVNYLAVLVAAVVSMVLGMIWYSPAVFGKKWMSYMGISKESMEGHKKGMAGRYVAGFIASLVMAYVLAQFIGYVGASTAAAGAKVAFWAWLGFVATVSLGTVLWEMKPKGLYVLNIVYWLIAFKVMGAIIAAW